MHFPIGLNSRTGKALGLLAAAAGIALASAALAPAQAQTPQIILRCVEPLMANEDGTDCVMPPTQAKTPDNLTAFSILTGDGRHLGLFFKVGPDAWVGPSLDGGQEIQWKQTAADAATLILYAERPRIRTLLVYGDGTVSSSGLAGGSVLGDRQY